MFFEFEMFSLVILKDCCHRNKEISSEFYPADMKNLDYCNSKGYIIIDADECYFKSNGEDVIYNSKVNYDRACYYDSDKKKTIVV